jgi:hypothetical protein
MSASLFPQLEPGQQLVGIAKLAAEGEAVDEGHNVEYITLENRSVLTRCLSPRMPFYLDDQSLSRLRICLQILLCPLHP